MLSLSPLERGTSYHLDDHRIIDTFSGEIVVNATNSVLDAQKNDRYYQQLKNHNIDYFNRPKYLGAIADHDLLTIGWRNIDAVETIDDSAPDAELLIAETYELAASAFTEASFVQTMNSNNDVNTVDARLDLIDLAEKCLELAIQSMSLSQTTLKQRLQIKLDFCRIHRDITCGEITEESVHELIEKLGMHLYKTYNNVDSIHSRGLGGEVRVLLSDWQNYQDGSGLVTLPASVRGDSGFYFQHETHDFDVITQNKKGRWEICTPKEVKRRKIKAWMLKRYKESDLVYVTPASGIQTVQYARSFHLSTSQK